MKQTKTLLASTLLIFSAACMAFGQDQNANNDTNNCATLPDHSALKSALVAAVAAEGSGLNNQMWATIVDRDGVVCAVAYSGVDRGAQWPGSRVISAQKANTGNAFSLDKTPPAGDQAS